MSIIRNRRPAAIPLVVNNAQSAPTLMIPITQSTDRFSLTPTRYNLARNEGSPVNTGRKAEPQRPKTLRGRSDVLTEKGPPKRTRPVDVRPDD